ncbi:MAG TPA: BTAD domain-containing putative transcriptional regulator [Longimicrobiales bacterium]|nr:BTAD domain-containing putative transcriptional regulator [Longimicrobiales bacterium]
MHRLKLFGGASIEGPSGPLTGQPVQRRRLALLALLAAAPRGVSRDKLVAYLWPDSDMERARRLLSDSVYRINQAVGGEAIVSVGDELRLDTRRMACDVVEFGDAVDRGDWGRAVGLYVGPFLDGFFLTGAAEFERWADGERERFRLERARALEKLATDADAANDPATAVRWWRMLAADDPYSSRIALLLMAALERAGDRAAAVTYARVHATLVRDDMGVEPDPEIAAFVERLRVPPDTVPEPAPAGRAESAPTDTSSERTPTARPPSPRADTPADVPRAARQPSPRRLFPAAAAIAAVAALAALVWAVSESREGPGAVSENPAIAVMPFADISPGRDQAYLADGLTEELIVRLSQAGGMNVVGRSSVYALAGEHVDARDIAERLNVSAILEGSVRRADDRLRISVQLVDAGNGYQLWSETYEREVQDVFAVQDEIAHAVVARLTGRLGDMNGRAATSPVDDPEAYNLYLKGRFEWHRRTEQGLHNAASYFRQAVERAPEYARAYAGLGDALAVLGFYDYLPPAEAFPPAREAATRAARIDPSLAQPHATLGYVALYHEWDWLRAEDEFLHATRLDPSYSTGHQWYANFLTAMGRFEEAVREMRAAQDLDPLSLIANAALGWVLYYAGEYERSIDQLDRTLELNPDFELAYLWRGLALEELDRFTDARQSLERAVELSGGTAITLAALARNHALTGDRQHARALLADLEERAGARYVPAFEVAKVHEALGDRVQALRWLERAREQRSHSIAFLVVDPQLARLRNDPDFARLVRDVGLDRRPMSPPRR